MNWFLNIFKKRTPEENIPMKKFLIVGLGNIGSEYANTRHNIGFKILDYIANQEGISFQTVKLGEVAELKIKGRTLLLLKPNTYMNLSGKAVGALANFFRITPEEILVAHDELDLPPGVAKFKLGGGHGGHNGLKDIIAKLANDKNFYRLRLGIGHPGDKNQVSGYVLGKAPAKEQELIEAAIDEAVRSTEILFKQDMVKAMNRLHSFKAQ